MRFYPATWLRFPRAGFKKVNGTHEMIAPADEPIDFRAIYYTLREKAWVLAACAGLGALVGTIYILATPKIYEAETIVQVEQAPRRVVNIQDVNSEDLGSDELLKTIEQNLSSPVLLSRVIHACKLDAAALGLARQPNKPYPENELIRALARSTTAKLVRGTRLISVVAENRRPDLAQRISMALVEEYKHINTEQRMGSVAEANSFLVSEAARLKEKLRQSEQALQDYKERTQAVSLEETQNIIVEKLKELNAKLTAAKSERLKLEADYAQAQKLGEGKADQLLDLPSVAESKAVLEQKRIVAEQEGLVANLGKRYGPLHPKLIQASSQLDAQRAELTRVIANATASIGSSYEAANETETKFEKALREQEQKALELNKLAIPYNVLQREVESDRALYGSVVDRMKETDVVRSIQQDNIIVKAPALLPDKPVKPHRKLVLSGSILIALLLGVGGILGTRALDRSLRTVDEAERFLGLSALAVIPEAKKSSALQNNFLMLEQPGTPAAEGFRTLRTSLSLLRPETKWKSVAIMSALPGEGKTFCAVNYAIACAQQGLRTLLIDCDLRLRSLTKIFCGEGLPGVSDLITGQAILDICTQRTSIDELFVLTAGAHVSNPLELLSGAGFAQIMEGAKLGFDRIVVDTAPATAVSDTFLILKSVDSICLVVEAGNTSRDIDARALQKVIEADGKPLGFILNRVPAIPAVAAYYGYARGSYGDGVYGPEEVLSAVAPSNDGHQSEPGISQRAISIASRRQ